jgi:hypothetical protein
MKPTKESWQKLFDLINEREKLGFVCYETIEGIHECPIEDFCSQGVEGLLYDLNRDEVTTKTLMNEYTVNNLAVARVIRYLHAKVEDLTKKLEEKEKTSNNG